MPRQSTAVSHGPIRLNDTRAELIRRTLVLCADHELNASSFTVAITGLWRKIYESLPYPLKGLPSKTVNEIETFSATQIAT